VYGSRTGETSGRCPPRALRRHRLLHASPPVRAKPPRPQRGAPDKSSGPCARGAAEGPCDFSGRVMKKPLARERDSNMWWLGPRPHHHKLGFLSRPRPFHHAPGVRQALPCRGLLRCAAECAAKGHPGGLLRDLRRLRRSHMVPNPISDGGGPGNPQDDSPPKGATTPGGGQAAVHLHRALTLSWPYGVIGTG